MTAKTSEKLARALEDIGLETLAIRARRDEFHDFLTPHDLPQMELLNELDRALRLKAHGDPVLTNLIRKVRQEVINGDYDASLEESEEWARSKEGREAFAQMAKEAKGDDE